MDLFHNPQIKNIGIQRLECTELVKHIGFRVKQGKAKIPMLFLPCYWTLGKYLYFFEHWMCGNRMLPAIPVNNKCCPPASQQPLEPPPALSTWFILKGIHYREKQEAFYAGDTCSR